MTLEHKPAPDDPWQILAIAALFFIPGIGLLLSPSGLVLHGRASAAKYVETGPLIGESISRGTVHFLAFIAFAISATLVVFYFRLRKAIRGTHSRKEKSTE